MKFEKEITVEVSCNIEELLKILKENDFELKEVYDVNDIYMIDKKYKNIEDKLELLKHAILIRDIIEEQEVSVKYYLSTVYIETLKRHKARHEARGNGFGYEIRDLDGKAGAIVCGGMGRERNLIVDKRLTNFTPITHIKGEVNREGIRKMTPREWARLQGFPDDFKLELRFHIFQGI